MLSGLDVQLFLRALYAVAHLPDVDDGVAVDQQSQLVVAADVEDERLIARGDEGAVETR